MNKKMKMNLVLILAGIVVIAVNLFLNSSLKNQAARDTEPATATVVDYFIGTANSSADDIGDTVYYPVVTYEVNGETIESQYTQYDYNENYDIGEQIDIKYNPDDPEEFVIVGDKAFESGNYWTIIGGAALLILGLARIIASVIGK